MIETDDHNTIPVIIPQWYPNEPTACPTGELSEKCDRLISEYKRQHQKNQELKAIIERQEKEKLLLTQPQFFETEMSKLALTIKVYQQTLEELEQLSTKTLEQLQNSVNS